MFVTEVTSYCKIKSYDLVPVICFSQKFVDQKCFPNAVIEQVMNYIQNILVEIVNVVNGTMKQLKH